MPLKPWLELMQKPDAVLDVFVRPRDMPQLTAAWWVSELRRFPEDAVRLETVGIEHQVYPLDDDWVIVLVETIRINPPPIPPPPPPPLPGEPPF